MNVVLGGCYIYPVKSCAGVQVEALRFDDAGQIIGDRQWVIVDERQCMTWLGAVPRLAHLRPQFTPTGWSLCSPANDAVMLPPARQGARCTVQAWNGERAAFDSLDGYDTGDEIARYVSDVAGKVLRVVWLETQQHRPNPVHLTTVSSLRRLAAEIGLSVESLSSHRRFRPNLVLDAPPGETLEAFAEERIVALTRSSLRLEVSGLCARCIVVDVDPDSAHLDGRYLAVTKQQSAQRYPGEPAYFGIYAHASGPGQLSSGDLMAMQLRA